MNISKKTQQKLINNLNQANKLIDEKAFLSAQRTIKDAIREVNNIEVEWEIWRIKNGNRTTRPKQKKI